jgi:hypothetical protein
MLTPDFERAHWQGPVGKKGSGEKMRSLASGGRCVA